MVRPRSCWVYSPRHNGRLVLSPSHPHSCTPRPFGLDLCLEYKPHLISASSIRYQHTHVLTSRPACPCPPCQQLLTRTPSDYPRAFEIFYNRQGRASGGQDVETIVNARTRPSTYDMRGWPYFEASVGGLVKDPKLLLDLGKLHTDKVKGAHRHIGGLLDVCQLPRHPPLTPSAFREHLAKKSFFNREADFPLVAGMYERAFKRRIIPNVCYEYVGLHWARVECQLLCELFATGVLVGCLRIDLRGNHFRPHDIELIEAAIKKGRARGLGFEPTDVKIHAQKGRPAPRLCTKMEAGAAGGTVAYSKAQAAAATGRLGVG